MDDETTGKPPDDTELTRVTPPAADDGTRVMPPAGEGETQVMPGQDTGATQVMPAAGGAPPPPPPAQPTLLMTHSRSSGSGGVPWWVWLIIVLLVIAAAAAVWFLYLRPADPSSAGEQFIGNWAPEAGTGGGLVISQTTDDQFKITQYDGQLEAVGSTTADLVDDQLEVSVQASALGLTGVTGTVQGTLTHESANDSLTLQFTSGDLQLEPVTFVRVEVLLPASPTPTPSPSPSPSPTPSPSPSVSTSPSASSSPTTDQQVIDAIAKLQVGIVTWASANNNLYPPPQDVVEGGGISQYVDPWPTNPFTGQPMTPGTAPGSYVYEQLSGGQGYRLTGYLGNGLTYTVP
jgi:hypothetical protein